MRGRGPAWFGTMVAAHGGRLDTVMIETRVIVEASPERTWQAWVYAGEVTRWFSPAANVERHVGGAYELFFNPKDPSTDSTIGCKILTYDEPSELAFTWKGPKELAAVMNGDESKLTRVRVTFRPVDGKTEVTVQHTGWGEGPEWEKARQWHVRAWEMVLTSLQKHLAGGGAEPCCQ